MGRWFLVGLLALVAIACGSASEAPIAPPPESEVVGAAGSDREAGDVSGTLRLYTSISQEPVDAVLAAFREAHPDVDVELFRAPTGELTARLAAERREGDIQADVLWLSDPLSMQQYAAEGLLADLEPEGADALSAEFRSEQFFGTHFLEVVAVHQPGLDPAPTSWRDLADPAYADGVAIPDAGFAGTAFGALGYFALAEDYGLDYYRALAENGAVQVQAPGEVVTGVAEGRFVAGMTLGFLAENAIADGAPLEIVRPEPGAIAVYSPVAVLSESDNGEAAESLVEFLLTPAGQDLLVEVGGYESIRDAEDAATRVVPDWPAIFDQQDELLEEYRTIFSG